MVIPDSLTTTGYFYNIITPARFTNFAQLEPKGQLSLNLAIKPEHVTYCVFHQPPPSKNPLEGPE